MRWRYPSQTRSRNWHEIFASKWGRALIWQAPSDAVAACVLAHGAGAGMAHRNMQAIADAFEAAGLATLRFDFPFIMEGRKRVDSREVTLKALGEAFDAARRRTTLPLWAGGHSFGGRMASHAVADGIIEPHGLIYCSFPLHAAGRPSISRAAHLGSIDKPMLFLSGTRDQLAQGALLESVVAGLGNAQLHWLATADHGYRILKRNRTSSEDVFDEMARVARAFVDAQG